MHPDFTRRQNIILAALAAEGDSEFAPVQVQKLFFLLDENIANEMGGKQFDFQPYDYGPFDKSVYDELEGLAASGYVQIAQRAPGPGGRRYAATAAGRAIGQVALDSAPSRAREYIKSIAQWVRSVSFSSLVGAIYRSYPHMRANSIFKD